MRKYVISRDVTTKNGKQHTKRPKIQRLVTPLSLQRKRHLCVPGLASFVCCSFLMLPPAFLCIRAAVKHESVTRNKAEKAEYERVLAQRAKDKRASSKRSSRRSSRKVSKKEE